MKVLLVGDGAREHMLAEQIARSSELYVAMEKRNPGIEGICSRFFVSKYSNIEAIGSFAIKEKVDIALVTSESALAKGLADALSEAGVMMASPPSSGSVIGENTVYLSNLMESAGIARPDSRVCKSKADIRKAMRELEKVVVKPSVRIEWRGMRFSEKDFRNRKEIEEYGMQLIKRHGSVVLERVVDGETFSLQALTDGKGLSAMPPVRTMKRKSEDPGSELTEGMGGFSSGRLLPFMRGRELESAQSSLRRLVAMLRKKGVEYRGPIGGDFMIGGKGVIMLNAFATLGDVETLNNFLALHTQFVEVLESIAHGRLKPVSFREMCTVVKYLVPQKYPGESRKSRFRLEERALWDSGAKAYLDTVSVKDGKMFTGRGRALAVCAKAGTLEEAEAKAETAAISIKGKLVYRKDIGSASHIQRARKHMALIRSM